MGLTLHNFSSQMEQFSFLTNFLINKWSQTQQLERVVNHLKIQVLPKSSGSRFPFGRESGDFFQGFKRKFNTHTININDLWCKIRSENFAAGRAETDLLETAVELWMTQSVYRFPPSIIRFLIPRRKFCHEIFKNIWKIQNDSYTCRMGK